MLLPGSLHLIIDRASMANAVNDHEMVLAKDFVNDSIVALTKFEKPCEVSSQGLRSDVLDVLSQPSNAAHKAAGDGGSSRSNSRLAPLRIRGVNTG